MEKEGIEHVGFDRLVALLAGQPSALPTAASLILELAN
jgi:hypothetical protein